MALEIRALKMLHTKISYLKQVSLMIGLETFNEWDTIFFYNIFHKVWVVILNVKSLTDMSWGINTCNSIWRSILIW